MARQYVITEEEYQTLLDKLEIHRLRLENVCDPCPCMMRGVTVENGRYVRREDLGPTDRQAADRAKARADIASILASENLPVINDVGGA